MNCPGVGPQRPCAFDDGVERPSSGEMFPPVINLNVGGWLYCTTLATLRRDQRSMLSAMFSGAVGLTKDEKGAFFIDYDGSSFGDILNFLRGDGSFFVPDSTMEREKLQRAALYFQVIDLIQLLAGTLDEKTSLVSSTLAIANEGAKRTALRTLATVGAFGFRFVIFGLVLPMQGLAATEEEPPALP